VSLNRIFGEMLLKKNFDMHRPPTTSLHAKFADILLGTMSTFLLNEYDDDDDDDDDDNDFILFALIAV